MADASVVKLPPTIEEHIAALEEKVSVLTTEQEASHAMTISHEKQLKHLESHGIGKNWNRE